ncbi:MAG: class I SAM-dependent methyltransferase [Candidatus Omnitrophota bacterium]
MENFNFNYKNNSVRTRYKKDTASNYDKKREKRKKWKLEMGAINEIGASLDNDPTIVDVPTGTGRILLPLTKASHRVYGIDISMDMLLQTKTKYASNPVEILRGDAVTLPLKDKSVDYVFCLRLLNWVTEKTTTKMLNEFGRVSRKGLVIGIRTEKPLNVLDFIRFGILNLIPTPHHVSHWTSTIKTFANRVKGKLTFETRRLLGKKPQSNSGKKEFNIKMYYNKDKLFGLFSGLGLVIEKEFYIDTLCSFSKRLARPYSIYVLKFRDGRAR